MKRRGFEHWFGRRELPTQLPDATLAQYYKFLRNGRCERNKIVAAEKIILSHLRLGMSVVAKYAVTSPYKTDEMVSEMVWALVHGVSMISEGAIDHHKPINIPAYLVATIEGYIRKFLTRDRLLGVHEQTFHKRGGFKRLAIEIAATENSDSGVLEIINKSIVTDQEKQIIGLRTSGLNDTQIGDLIGLSKQRVQQIRDGVRKRIEKELAHVRKT